MLHAPQKFEESGPIDWSDLPTWIGKQYGSTEEKGDVPNVASDWVERSTLDVKYTFIAPAGVVTIGGMARRWRNNNSIAMIVGGVLAYYLLVAFCLSEPLYQGAADDSTVKGKGKDGECTDYALALSARLAANGIHGQLIFYRWHVRNTAIEGSHVLVAYRLPDDSEWIVDNEIPHPRRVPREASPMQLVFLLSDAQSAPVDVELQDGLNHLSYF